MNGLREEPLPRYGLPDGWTGERCLVTDVLDVWEGHHCGPSSDRPIVVHVQRRAIHGPTGSLRITGPHDRITFDAAFALMLRASQAKLVELRQRGEREGDRDALRRAVHDLDDAAERVAHDAAAWRPARLTIDGEPVEAVETTYERWWLVLHGGVGRTADIYVYGPPNTRPESLALSRVSAAAYSKVDAS